MGNVDWLFDCHYGRLIGWLNELSFRLYDFRMIVWFGKERVFFPLSIGGFLVASESSTFHEKPKNHSDDEIKFWKHREQISRMSARYKTEILAQ